MVFVTSMCFCLPFSPGSSHLLGLSVTATTEEQIRTALHGVTSSHLLWETPPSGRWYGLAGVEPERCLLSSGPLPEPCRSHAFGTQGIQWEHFQSSAHLHMLLHCLEKCHWTSQPPSDNGQAGFAMTLWIILLSLHHGRNGASKWHGNTKDLLVLSMDLRWFY